MIKIGVLSLQGDFAEHAVVLEKLGAVSMEVRKEADLEKVQGLIIPGGESTAIDRLTQGTGDSLFKCIQERAAFGMPIYGTCMGSIFLSREIEGSAQGRLSLMDIKVRRNAFGTQKMSFEEFLDIPELGTEPFPGVFIRAPLILSCGPEVTVLCCTTEGIVMARQNNLLVSTFHPELTNDLRVHKLFLTMIQSNL